MVNFLKDLNDIRKQRALKIAFICNSNSCRSLMAEVLFEKILLMEVNSQENLEKKKISILSGATHYSGHLASEKTVQVLMKEENINENRIKFHRGKMITEIDEPDLILTMTEEDVEAIFYEFPSWDDKTFALDFFVKLGTDKAPVDIEDPIGGTYEDFVITKNRIKKNLLILFKAVKAAGLLTCVEETIGCPSDF